MAVSGSSISPGNTTKPASGPSIDGTVTNGIVLSPSYGKPGDTIIVNLVGTYCSDGYYRSIYISIDNPSGGSFVLGSMASGSTTLTFTIPEDAEAGSYIISGGCDVSSKPAGAPSTNATWTGSNATLLVQAVECTEHEWDSGTVTKEATCTENGVKTFTCRRSGCGSTKTEEITAIGHTASPDLSGYVAPTHTTPGYSGDVVCATCGEVITPGHAIEASGHVMGEWKPNGSDTHVRICSDGPDCNIETEAHSFSEWVIDAEPTCTEDGSKSRTCPVCNYVEAEIIPALGHDMRNGSISQRATRHTAGVFTCKCSRCDHKVNTLYHKMKHNKPKD